MSLKLTLTVAAAMLCGICRAAQAPPAQPHATAQVAAGYVMGADDIIDISVPSHSDADRELDRTLVILPDGTIEYPEAGRVMAAGRTPEQLASVIRTALEKTRKNVLVVVSVREVHSRRVRILGAVKDAGSYDLKPNWRLLDVVAIAGGLTTLPSYISGRIVRGNAVLPLNIADAIARPESDANMPISNEDMILLDEHNIRDQVHAMGQVNKPGAYDLEEGLNVISLVSEAGSPTDRASLHEAYILRNGTQIPMDLYPSLFLHQLDHHVTDFKLQPGDILTIPEIIDQIGVMGYVRAPGYFPMPENRQDATLLKALGTAGGQAPDGDLRHCVLIHTANGITTRTRVSIEDILKHGKVELNTVMQPGDVLWVPNRKKPSGGLDFLAPVQMLYFLMRL